jgi:hypothetical protein
VATARQFRHEVSSQTCYERLVTAAWQLRRLLTTLRPFRPAQTAAFRLSLSISDAAAGEKSRPATGVLGACRNGRRDDGAKVVREIVGFGEGSGLLLIDARGSA